MKNLIYFLTIIFFFTIFELTCSKKEDLYKLLNVTVSATPLIIRRAFKILALKYHPDKNKNNKQWAQGMFMKIANAYEILSDPIKRKNYDEGGDEDNYHEESENMNEYEKSKKNQGKRDYDYNQNHEDEDDDPKKKQKTNYNYESYTEEDSEEFFYDFENNNDEMETSLNFESANVVEITMNNIWNVYNRNIIWMILCYSPRSIITDTINIWKEFALVTKDLLITGAINCSLNEEICYELGVTSFSNPIIVYLPENQNILGESYKGEINLEKLMKYAMLQLKPKIQYINLKNYKSFFNFNAFSQKVVIFTIDKTCPDYIMLLSLKFKGKITFGLITKKKKGLIKKYNVKRFPTIIIARDLDNWVTYSGNVNIESLSNFFSKFTVKSPNSSEIRLFSDKIYTNDKVCNDDDSNNICFIFLNRNDYVSLETKNLLEELANRYVNDSYKFFYANLIEIKNFTSIFWKNDLNNNVYLIRGKRKKYCVYKGKMDFNEISNFLDKVLSGGGTFKQLNQNFKFRNVKRDL